MNTQAWVYVVGLFITVIGAVIAATWKLSGDLGSIRVDMASVKAKVELILTNHLPHLAEDIQELKERK